MSKSTILVVDDDQDLREVLVDSFREADYNVLSAAAGDEALEILKCSRVNVMLSDVNMPGMSGIELFKLTCKLGIPTVLISGLTSPLDVEKASSLGVVDYLTKPFKTEDLLNTIEVALLSSETSLLDENELDTRFCRVGIENFLSGSRASQDVFVRIAGQKFLRIARANSVLSMERVRTYYEKGLRFLYIRNEDFGQYVGFNVELSKAATSLKSRIPKEQKIRLLKQTSALYLENLRVNGITCEAYDSGRVLVETTLTQIVGNDDLFSLIELLKNHDDPSFAHSLAVSLYGTMLARQLGWENPSVLFKLAMAGLLINVGEKEIPVDVIKKYHSNRLTMTAAEVQLYESHPDRGAGLLKNVDNVPEEVRIAVLQHHENMAGLGFPHRPPRMKLHAFSRILNLVSAYCEITFSELRKGHAVDPTLAMAQLYPARENEFDPQMVRALFGVLQLPIPAKLNNIRGDSAAVG